MPRDSDEEISAAETEMGIAGVCVRVDERDALYLWCRLVAHVTDLRFNVQPLRYNMRNLSKTTVDIERSKCADKTTVKIGDSAGGRWFEVNAFAIHQLIWFRLSRCSISRRIFSCLPSFQPNGNIGSLSSRR